MNLKRIIILFLSIASFASYGQIGGLRAFEFLEFPNHAKVAGLGTVNITSGEDVNMVNQNPALLDSSMLQDVSITIAPYFDDILTTQVNYATSIKSVGLVHFGVLYQSLGTFKGYNDVGDPTADFSAGNYAISASHSRTQGVFNYGASLKVAGMQLTSSKSTALLADMGLLFKHPETDLNFGMTIKNVGFYLQKEAEEDRPLPFDILLGGTFKPAFMPFRFSLSINRLYQYDLSYFEPVANDPNNPFTDAGSTPPSTFDKLFQHVTIGTELLLGKNISLRGGYNHLIRQSLRSEEFAGGGGFTFGLNIQTKKFQLAYSNALYQIGGGAHFITVGTNFNSIFN